MFTDSMRPSTFEEMVGNDALKAVLSGQLKSGKVSHTILLVGGAGTGKTCTARILATALDAQVEEINCGADTGIDKIRGIIETQSLSPLMGSSRMYILDEVHALSKPAQQALLKPAEEPSPTTYFILCTSDPSKVDVALRTRCLELKTQNLDELSNANLAEAVQRLLKKMPDFKFEAMSDLNSVIESAGTSYRNLYNTLEKLYSATPENSAGIRIVPSSLVKTIVGSTSKERGENLANLAKAMLSRKTVESLDIVKSLEKENTLPYPTMLGVYKYLKAVAIKGGTVRAEYLPILTDLSIFLAEYEITWMHVEHFILKSHK